MNAHQVLSRIRREIIDSGRDTRYLLGAYGFVLNGLEFYLAKIGDKRHVSGQELSGGLAQFAAKQFGPLAWDVLAYWGIRATDDFGNIVYALIDIGLLSKRESDSISDFSSVFDLKAFFEAQSLFAIDPKAGLTL